MLALPFGLECNNSLSFGLLCLREVAEFNSITYEHTNATMIHFVFHLKSRTKVNQKIPGSGKVWQVTNVPFSRCQITLGETYLSLDISPTMVTKLKSLLV